MKPKFNIYSFLITCGLLFFVKPLHAQLTWDANGATTGQTDGGGTWTNPSMWWDGGANVNWTDGLNATFGNGGAGGTVTVGTVTTGSVSLDNFTGNYTLQNGTITQSGGFSLGGNAGRVTLKSLTLAGSGGLTVAGGILQTNGSTLSYTGTTLVTGGGVLLSFNNLSSSNLTLNNGQLSDYYRATTIFSGGLGAGANQIQIYGNSGFGGGNGNSNFRIGASNSVLTWGALGEGSATGFFNPTALKLRTTADNNGPSIYGQVTLQNRLDLNSGSRTIEVFRSGANVFASAATIGGGIQDTGGAGSLIKTGGGTLFISGTNSTWGGITTVSDGVLDFGGTNIANIGGGTGRNISVAAGAVVRFNALSNAILQRIVETSDEFTVMTGTTGNALDFSGSAGANLSGAFLSNYAGNGAKTEISGIITAGGGAYRLGSLFQSGALGIRQESLLSGDNQLIIGGNRVVIVGAHTFTGDTTIRDGGRLGLASYTGGTNSLALQNSVLDLGSTSSTGQLFFEAGVTGGITGLNLAANGGTQSATFGGLKGSRNLSAAFVTGNTGNNTTGNVLSNITGFTLNVDAGKSATYSGAIGGFGSGATGSTGGDSTLTKTGLGTQILTGTNTYTGATFVEGGILAISGAGSINNSAVTVNGGEFSNNSSVAYSGALNFVSGKLSGTNWNGSFANLTIGAGQTVSPGNSPGIASITGGQTWAAGGTYVWEINNVTGTAGADPGWDMITGTGTLDITAGSGTEFTIDVTSLTLGNIAGDAVNFNQLLSYAWLIADFASVTGFDKADFIVDTADFSNTYSGTFDIALGDSGSIGGDNSQIWLTYTAIPEPRAALLGLIGLLLILRRRR